MELEKGFHRRLNEIASQVGHEVTGREKPDECSGYSRKLEGKEKVN